MVRRALARPLPPDADRRQQQLCGQDGHHVERRPSQGGQRGDVLRLHQDRCLPAVPSRGTAVVRTSGHRDRATITRASRATLFAQEVWFMVSPNMLTEPDPTKVVWELRPNASHGLEGTCAGGMSGGVPVGEVNLPHLPRIVCTWPPVPPPGQYFHNIMEEGHIVPLTTAGGFYAVARTDLGYLAASYTADSTGESVVCRHAPQICSPSAAPPTLCAVDVLRWLSKLWLGPALWVCCVLGPRLRPTQEPARSDHSQAVCQLPIPPVVSLVVVARCHRWRCASPVRLGLAVWDQVLLQLRDRV